MNKLMFKRMSNEINRLVYNELRDKILDNMKLNNVSNIDIIAEYLIELTFDDLINISKAAEILDWQTIGRIISKVAENYTDKEV